MLAASSACCNRRRLDQLGLEFVAFERHLDRGMQLTFRERLEQVAVGPGLARALQRGILSVGGQVDHRHRVGLAQARSDFDAVHGALDVDVHQHQVGQQFADEVQAFLARGGHGGNVVAQLLKAQLQVQRDDRFVFHHQDACGLCHGLGLSGNRSEKRVEGTRCTSS
jgi:hypothetical protein